MRKFFDEVILPDAVAREEDGKPPSKSVIEAMAKKNLHAMRMGPGKHLRGSFPLGSHFQVTNDSIGLVLMDGIVKPEEVGAIGCPTKNDFEH